MYNRKLFRYIKLYIYSTIYFMYRIVYYIPYTNNTVTKYRCVILLFTSSPGYAAQPDCCQCHWHKGAVAVATCRGDRGWICDHIQRRHWWGNSSVALFWLYLLTFDLSASSLLLLALSRAETVSHCRTRLLSLPDVSTTQNKPASVVQFF